MQGKSEVSHEQYADVAMHAFELPSPLVPAGRVCIASGYVTEANEVVLEAVSGSVAQLRAGARCRVALGTTSNWEWREGTVTDLCDDGRAHVQFDYDVSKPQLRGFFSPSRIVLI